jgi:hypothetical protein
MTWVDEAKKPEFFRPCNYCYLDFFMSRASGVIFCKIDFEDGSHRSPGNGAKRNITTLRKFTKLPFTRGFLQV